MNRGVCAADNNWADCDDAELIFFIHPLLCWLGSRNQAVAVEVAVVLEVVPLAAGEVPNAEVAHPAVKAPPAPLPAAGQIPSQPLDPPVPPLLFFFNCLLLVLFFCLIQIYCRKSIYLFICLFVYLFFLQRERRWG
jgi:hypothetical protein